MTWFAPKKTEHHGPWVYVVVDDDNDRLGTRSSQRGEFRYDILLYVPIFQLCLHKTYGF